MPATMEPPTKPAAPATPPPAAPEQSKPEAVSTDPNPINPAFEEFFKGYDAPKETPKPAEKPKGEPTKPTDSKPKEEGKPKPEAKTDKADKTEKADKQPEAKEPEAPAEPQFKTNKELKAAYESTKQRAKAFEERIKELEAKAQVASGKPDEAALKAFRDKEAELQTQIESLRQQVAKADFTQSQTYQEKYYKPYVNTWSRAINALKGVKAMDENGQATPITQEDAEFLLSLPDAKAIAEARKLFGDDNFTALAMFTAHKQRIAEAYDNLNQGKEEFKKLAEEENNKSASQKRAEDELMGRLWVKGNELMASKSEWLQSSESDPEGSELLQKGFELADRAFQANGTPEERVALHVQLRNRAAAYDRLVSAVKSRDEEIESLKAELAGYQESAPKHAPSGKEGGDHEKSFNEMIDEAFEKKK